MTLGCNDVKLEALKYDENNFSFDWKKKHTSKATAELNVLQFQDIKQEDYGYYKCEVKEGEKVVLTVFRALYKGKPNTESNEIKSLKVCSILLTYDSYGLIIIIPDK